METILDDALDMEANERESYIKKACHHDRSLYRDIILLIRCIREAEKKRFLE